MIEEHAKQHPPCTFLTRSLKARRWPSEVKRSGTECDQRATAQISLNFPDR
jgi:hypothetical protein